MDLLVKRRRLVIAILLCLAARPGLAVVLGYEVVTGSSLVDSSTYKNVSLNCPPGKFVLGGGARVIGSAPGLALDTSGPFTVPPPTDWIADAVETIPTNDNWSLEVNLICGVVPDYEVIMLEGAADSTDEKSQIVSCPAGKQVLGGGTRLWGTNSANVVLTASGPVGPAAAPTGWRSGAHEVVSLGNAWGLRTDVFCGNVLGYEVSTAIGLEDSTEPKSTLLVPPILPGQVLIGGGAQLFGLIAGTGLLASDADGPVNNPLAWLGSARELVATPDAWGLRVDAFVASEGPAPEPPQDPPGATVPIEYSNEFDEQALAGGGEGPLDPGQVLTTEPGGGAGLPRDGLDFAPGLESGNEPDAQIDALASGNDALLDELFSDSADLLVSVVGDAGGHEVAAFAEDLGASFAIRYRHADLNPADAGGVAGIEDVDGLELWGPETSSGDDARYYSLLNDSVLGTSVYLEQLGVQIPWVPQSFIVVAVQNLGYTGAPEDVDVDALLVRNGGVGGFVENPDDLIVFSIRGVPGSGFDGSELVVLSGDGSSSFLTHAGHAWDTGFALSPRLDALLGAAESASEDVDAIELPEPGLALGLSNGVLGLLALRRRAVRRRARAVRPSSATMSQWPRRSS